MDIIQTLILAIIQGITEWLPISSSGHLAIAQKYLRLTNDAAMVFFDIAIHVGTIIVVLVTFRKDIVNILKAFFQRDFGSEEGKLALLIIAGSIPTAIIGFMLLYFDIIDMLFSNLLIVGFALLFTSIFLYASRRVGDGKELDYVDSLLIGIAQGVATIPGISRSGSTISTGLLRKIKRETVFKYSFLLSIPAVLGAMAATIVKKYAILTTGSLNFELTALGVATSFIVGYIALQLLQKIFMKQKFYLFAYYCWIIGLLTVFLNFL